MEINTDTYWARIYVGLKELSNGMLYSVDKAKQLCQDYVNDLGLCVNVTETEFIYTGGGEPGVIIELINYPRFPCRDTVIRNHARVLAKKLLEGLKQLRLSIVFPDYTIMLTKE